MPGFGILACCEKKYSMEPIVKLANVIISIESLKTIFYWLNYQKSISTSNLLCESYMKIPLVECLERKLKAQVKTEVPHPCFSSRSVDLAYQNAIAGRKGYIELKYIRKNTAYNNEHQRIMNDLFRLYLAGKEKVDTANYFVVADEAEDFDSCFKNTGFAEYFPWEDDEYAKRTDYQEYWEEFCKVYKYENEPESLKKFKIQFVALYPDDESKENVSMKVCAWRII